MIPASRETFRPRRHHVVALSARTLCKVTSCAGADGLLSHPWRSRRALAPRAPFRQNARRTLAVLQDRALALTLPVSSLASKLGAMSVSALVDPGKTAKFGRPLPRARRRWICSRHARWTLNLTTPMGKTSAETEAAAMAPRARRGHRGSSPPCDWWLLKSRRVVSLESHPSDTTHSYDSGLLTDGSGSSLG